MHVHVRGQWHVLSVCYANLQSRNGTNDLLSLDTGEDKPPSICQCLDSVVSCPDYTPQQVATCDTARQIGAASGRSSSESRLYDALDLAALI